MSNLNPIDVKNLKTDSDKSNFLKVSNFNKVFGVDRYDTPQPNIFTKNPKLVELRLALITEEVNELIDAVKNHDFTEVVDALADILYVVYGAGDCFGVDLDEAYQIVHSSNMTKICKSEDEAIKTVEWYKSNASGIAIPVMTWPNSSGYCRRLHIQTIAYNVEKTISRTACYNNSSRNWQWFRE
jgi:predicted HAD superfamily Cof-like phosphohydrolase